MLLLALALAATSAPAARHAQFALPTPTHQCQVHAFQVTAAEVTFNCTKTDANGVQAQVGRFSFPRQGNEPWLEMVRASKQGKGAVSIGIYLSGDKVTGLSEP